MDSILMILLIVQWAFGWGWMDGQLVLVCLLAYLAGADIVARMR